MTDQQQRTSMEWIMSIATVAALSLSAWSLVTTHSHASRITALETQQQATDTRIDEKFDQLIALVSRTNADITELKEEVRRLRDRE